MKIFIKKFLAAALGVMAAIAIASGCFAEDGEEWKNNIGEIDLDNMTATGNGVSMEGNTVKITSGGDFNVTGTLADGMIYVNSEEKVKLRLSGADISNSAGPAIFFDNAEKAFITITENTENSLSDGKTYSVEDADGALFSNDDLEIKGSGTLNIIGGYKHGIAGDDDVSIENGIINITSYEHGIKANDTLSVSGGTITVVSETGKGMKADADVVIDNGTINITSKASEGIESKGTLTINGGDINVTSADDGINTGNESSDTGQNGAPAMQNGERPMHGGMAPPEGMAAPDGEMRRGGMGRGGMMDAETAAAHAITINGGNIHVTAEGDGIDSNGSLTINGGFITVDGPSNSGNGPLDAEGGMTMNGGTVIAAASAGMLQLPTAAEGINMLRASFDSAQTAGTAVSIKEKSSGAELAAMTPTKDFQAVMFASSELKSGSEYEIYLNGEQYASFKAEAGTTAIGNATFGGKGMGRGNWNGGAPNSNGGAARGDMSEIKVFVNGNRIKFDTAPIIKNDTTLVGFRAILESLGAAVEWDGDTRTVTAVKDDINIKLTIDSETAYVNNKAFSLLTAPEIINDSTMIPVRFISEQLGMNVSWDADARVITITSE